MEVTSEKRGFYSAADLAAFRLPNFPTTDRAARTRAESEGWEFVEEKSPGRGGVKRLYKPPQAIADLIAQHQLRAAFDDFRVRIASGEPLETAKGMFVSDYNEATGVVSRVPGLATLTSDQLDAALNGRPMTREYAVGHVSTRHAANERPPPEPAGQDLSESDLQLAVALDRILRVAEAQLGRDFMHFAVARSLIGVATHWRGVAERTGQLARLEAVRSAAEMYIAIEQQSETD